MPIRPFDIFKKSPHFHQVRYDHGTKVEDETLEVLRTLFNDPQLQKTIEGSVFDFESHKFLIELKSRTCCSSTYLDTCVGLNKIVAARNVIGKQVIFAFLFLDGLFFWLFEPKCPLREAEINGVPHCYIPVNKLTKHELYQV